MDISPSICLAVAIAATYLVYQYLLHPKWLSPLSRIPNAHPLCSFTPWWMKHQVSKSRELKTLQSAHSTYGPIVRLGPNEISVVSQEGLRKVYTAGLDKHPWYQSTFYAYGHQNLVATLDHRTHSTQKRMVAKWYAKSYLQRSPELAALSKHIIFDQLQPLLLRDIGKDVNVVDLFECVGVDFISGWVFGIQHGTDFLGNEAARGQYFHEYRRRKEGSMSYAESMFLNTCKTALSSHQAAKPGKAEETVFTSLHTQLSAAVKTGVLNVKDGDILTRCASEALDHVIATQETNTITWTYILYRLSLHPNMQAKLRAELRTLHPSLHESTSKATLPSPADIDALPLLDAIILETLRLHAANPARMRRVVPSGGIELHRIPIPSGTTVSTNAYCLHRNADVFPQPLNWRPDRWLVRTEDGTGDATAIPRSEAMRWFWAFGSGPRMCVGNNFAVQVIKLVVAVIYSQYTTSIVNDDGIEQSDSYNSGPVGRKLILQFNSVDG